MARPQRRRVGSRRHGHRVSPCGDSQRHMLTIPATPATHATPATPTTPGDPGTPGAPGTTGTPGTPGTPNAACNARARPDLPGPYGLGWSRARLPAAGRGPAAARPLRCLVDRGRSLLDSSLVDHSLVDLNWCDLSWRDLSWCDLSWRDRSLCAR